MRFPPNGEGTPYEAARIEHDPLTGLPTRRALAALLDAARIAAHPMHAISMLMVNLDRFKAVNDLCGHATGDRVLVVVAERLCAIAGERAQLLHLGGDEFACLIAHPAASDAPTRLAKAMLSAIAEPIDAQGRVIELGASIGITYDDGCARTAGDLLRTACIALTQAKNDGGRAQRSFDPAMELNLRNRAILKHDLRSGIRRGELIPYYQPIFALDGSVLMGFESLARWNHPRRGMIDPDTFIPIAEDLDAINDLCFMLLRQACRDMRSWPPHLTLSINISPIQICDPELPLRLLQILYAGGVAPGRLIVEITENALVRDIMAARNTIESLRNAGVKVALDDFGTGYSSLHHLRELQFDRIKIDRSFIHALDDPAGERIVQAIIGLGESLGMHVTAEGIETTEQANALSQLGCGYGQGFLLGHPMPSAATLRLIIALDDAAAVAPGESRKRHQR